MILWVCIRSITQQEMPK